MSFRQSFRRFRHALARRAEATSLAQDSAQPLASLSSPSSPSDPLVPDRQVDQYGGIQAHPVTQPDTADLRNQWPVAPPTVAGISPDIAPFDQGVNPHEPQPTQVAAPINLSTASPRLPTVLVHLTTAPESPSKCNWASLREFCGKIPKSSCIPNPLRAVVDDLMECTAVYEKMATGRSEFKKLRDDLEGLFESLSQHFSQPSSPAITSSIEKICDSILKELSYVKEKQARGSLGKLISGADDVQYVLSCYRRIQSHLERLTLNTNLTIWRIVDEQLTDFRLDRLCPSLSACYNSRQAAELQRDRCTPGTRVEVLGQMYAWVHNQTSGLVYWLNGMAGTGKTTIAYSLCAELDTTHNLGASFFCSRLLPECRDVNQIIPSIAYQLARFSRPYRSALSRVLEKERDIHTQLLHIQFDILLVKPLAESREAIPEDLVVVIDALDECDNKTSTRQILETLLLKAFGLPIKFFIASRPEPEIRDHMKKWAGHRPISRLVLHELDQGTVQGDVGMFLREALSPIRPSESDIRALVQRAGILFIYAATVARYIGYNNFGRNPRARLNTILNLTITTGNHPYQEIDRLYTVILRAAIGDSALSDQERDDMRQVLNTVLCAREPLTISTISGLTGLHDVERVHAALHPMWSVLHIVESNELVTTLHASFPDYMFDPGRSGDYCCDSAIQDSILTSFCFDCMRNASPQFNICGLESSYLLDREIVDLDARVKASISSELLYSCRYWSTHLECANCPHNLFEEVEDFLSKRLLLWMEIMNISSCMNGGVGVMRRAEEWCLAHSCSKELVQLSHDVWRFVAAFTSNPVSQSTPHIYLSMLPFWPESSPIFKHYAKCMLTPMIPQGSAIPRRRLDLLSTWSVDGAVSQVAWLSDDTRIALVIRGEIFLLDSLTGKIHHGPLQKGPASAVSIAFSPDGTRLAAGSRDGSIDIWDARDGRVVLDSIPAHVSSITSIAFSPDGNQLISGSYDATVCVWDANSGRKLCGPLEKCASTIRVRPHFFVPRTLPDVSISTVYIWNEVHKKAEPIGVHRHIGAVTSVAFSPSGREIVAGYTDETICVWTLQGQNLRIIRGASYTISSFASRPEAFMADTPQSTSAPLFHGPTPRPIRVCDRHGKDLGCVPVKEHVDSITSLAFSPDGACLASGCTDNTILLWSTETHKKIGLLEGHTKSINSIAFSPNGTHIVSGSNDRTVRMWDIRSRQTVLGPLKGHTSKVSSVAFSPDGTRIISGSPDRTVHIWDARSEQVIFSSLAGLTHLVTSASFTSDGAHIISGLRDGTVRIWETRAGKLVHAPLKSHTDSVTSTACSKDGCYVVSGSYDRTICVWNIQNRQIALGPLKGHTGFVSSVTYSPDGTRIASGSYDTTILVWDAQTGKIIFSPLEGHTNSITSVAFSPNSSCIASSSYDKTVRIWNAQTGESISPLLEHSEAVTSIAFSPNGHRLITGACDNTIRAWDVESGQLTLGPLSGHTNAVTSVAFSPNGTQFVSGSSDGTLRIWDARTGQLVTGPLEEHTDSVTSVGFSPDGTMVVSGSDDETVCVWDVRCKKTEGQSASFDNDTPPAWKVNTDGWVVEDGTNSRRLVWVPPDLRALLLSKRNILKISSEQAYVGLNFINARIGDAWTECYRPAKV